ncbi:MAG TPA: hypothetical protein VN667_04830 [Burkholderiales bacterium]|nr:hypothetical protein [Burkholderiales bacterium]
MTDEDQSSKESAAADPARAERVRRALLAAIEDQLKRGDPPEARQTLARLLAEGHTKQNALQLIAFALVAEVTDVLRNNSAYNRERYVANLNRLPKLPWEGDGGEAGS